MEEKVSSTYYNLIMGNSDQSFKHLFHTKWISFLDNLSMPYAKALQLRIGNHLRPLLVYWGSALGVEKKEDIPLNDISDLAVCVEILHKVSIIVDDLIDKDIKRHNKSTFHIEFSPEETIIFSVYLLGFAFEKINTLSQKYSDLENPFNNIYAKTLQEMAAGCLSELTLIYEKRYDYLNIVNIISQETSTLIKNSILLGYITNRPQDKKTIQTVELIGEKVGFLFQAMNDLEPFCSHQNLTLYKGGLNLDFDRSRKNIVLPYIFGCCSTYEKKILLNINTVSTHIILELYKKYNVESIIKNDLISIEKQLENHFKHLETMQINLCCLKDFKLFYNDIIKIAKSRLNGIYQEPID